MNQMDTLLIVLGQAIDQLGGELRVYDNILANADAPVITVTADRANMCRIYTKKERRVKRCKYVITDPDTHKFKFGCNTLRDTTHAFCKHHRELYKELHDLCEELRAGAEG